MLQFVMTHLQIKNVPPEIHEALRRRAARENMTMSDYVLDLLSRDLALPTQREWLARLHDRTPVLIEDEALKALHEARDERARELTAARDRH
jgi:antitoxin FitA